MSKAKLTCTTPYGVLTRSTDRTYTHVVIGIGRHEATIRAESASSVDFHKQMVAKYSAIVESGIVPSRYNYASLEDYKGYLADSLERLETAPARLEKALLNNAAAIELKKIQEVTWTGRPDLAEKAAAKFRSNHFIVEVYPVD